METLALEKVREEIEAMYAARDRDFRLPARYQTLTKLEAGLIAHRNARKLREVIAERRIVGPHAAPHVAVPHAYAG